MFLISIISLITSCYAYSSCSGSNNPYAGKNVIVPIVQTQYRPTGPGVQGDARNFNIQVAGNIVITHGCGFSVQNFTYTGPGVPDTTVWYGSIEGDTSGLYSVALTDNTPVNVSPTVPISQSFDFTNRTGSSVSYNDFNVFVLFTLSNSMVLAKAVIPNAANIQVPNPKDGVLPNYPLATVSPSSPKSTATPKTTSNGFGLKSSVGLVLCIVLWHSLHVFLFN